MNSVDMKQIIQQQVDTAHCIPSIANVQDAMERLSIQSQDTVDVFDVIPLENEVFRMGTAISYSPEEAIFTLNTNGIYQVSYKANANKTDIVTPDLALGIEQDRSLLMLNTVVQHYVSDTFTVVPLSNTVLFNVTTAPMEIRLVAVNMYGRYRLATMNIAKIG